MRDGILLRSISLWTIAIGTKLESPPTFNYSALYEKCLVSNRVVCDDVVRTVERQEASGAGAAQVSKKVR
jgi:hypothetical protein